MKDSEFKNFFSAIFSILNKPQLTKRYVKGLLRGQLSMFDKVKIKENLGIIYFSKKEDKYYKIDSDTGERAEIDKSKISHQNV
jgi:hypothetical protein